MEMNQERLMKLEAIIDMALKVIIRKNNELDELNSKIEVVQNLKLRYQNEITTFNKIIIRIAESKDSKRQKYLQTKRRKKPLANAMKKKQNIDSTLHSILEKKKNLLDKLTELLLLPLEPYLLLFQVSLVALDSFPFLLSTALLITPVSFVLLHFSVLLAFLILFAIFLSADLLHPILLLAIKKSKGDRRRVTRD
jgi:hypothetical protein